MRLSEAVLAGSVLIKAVPFSRGIGGNTRVEGCALGMAERAISLERYAEDEWPWLHGCATPPCEHTHYIQPPIFRFPIETYLSCVAHIFNEHVMGELTWTLEQLCDWIRSVEPSEPSEPVRETQGEHVEVERVAQ